MLAALTTKTKTHKNKGTGGNFGGDGMFITGEDNTSICIKQLIKL